MTEDIRALPTTDHAATESTQQSTAAPRQAREVGEAVARLQAELADLITGEASRSATESLDNAVASLREVEHRNVTSVQLVALGSA